MCFHTPAHKAATPRHLYLYCGKELSASDAAAKYGELSAQSGFDRYASERAFPEIVAQGHLHFIYDVSGIVVTAGA